MLVFFFDLDGTLSDSRHGLFPSFRAALDAIGVPPVGDDALNGFLGTPLPEMFRHLRPVIGEAEIAAGIAAFRRVYEAEGIAGNRLYRGIRTLLETLKDRGHRSWVVTSKPEHYAVAIVARLGLDRLVGGVVGAGLAETDTKTGLIARALAAAAVAPARAIMCGDRHYDVEGALANGVVPVGALWGYGSEAELYHAGCRHFAVSPDDFRERYADGVPAAAARRSSSERRG